jgi:hypothetical protein
MIKIINSKLDPFEGVDIDKDSLPILEQRLGDNNYLVALIQRNIIQDWKFNPDDDRYADMTPSVWAKYLKATIEDLEDKCIKAIYQAADSLEIKLRSSSS